MAVSRCICLILGAKIGPVTINTSVILPDLCHLIDTDMMGPIFASLL